jgi:glutathione S-transferase
MATRIAFYESGIEGRFIAVDTRAKRLADGTDFLAVNPMGQVPVLRAADRESCRAAICR